ncbi:SPOR domain-containing protein [Salinisphaera sp. SPP-AMP-43]|uniref:SPOR domain-containing protein n=1 Tax=Salinisphaera sp. SPP-AMP-43 TaxID=3121288 RepID=UPI003C6E8509
MARDYSSRRNDPPNSNSGKRKTPKRAKPAATSARSKPKSSAKKNGSSPRRNTATRRGAPGWVWFACGLLVAIVIGSIYYIASRPAGHGPESVSIDVPHQSQDNDTETSNSQPPAAAPKAADDGQSEPRFSFYKMLPNYKVEVPANQRHTQPAPVDAHTPHEAEAAVETPAPASTSHQPSSGSASNAPSDNSTGDAGTGYVIQAGAFSTHDDADHRKARLALLGVTARIVDVKTSSGKTVYRVQSGTVNTRAKAQNLAQRLKSHGIETMVRHAD